MNISGINGNVSQAPQSGAGKAMDAQSRNIQKQITEAQKELQEISVRGDLSQEEKMKKRQEIQKQISDLKMQLRQHQTEVKRQEQEEKRAAAEAGKGSGKTGEPDNGFSAAGMQAVLSADVSMKQARVQKSTADQLEGKAKVLEIEIKQDGRTGGNTERKEAELAEVNKRAAAAAASGISTLKEANQKAEGAAETEQESKVKEADAKTQKAVKGTEEEKAEKEKEEAGGRDQSGAEDNTLKEPGKYVDVRL